MRAKKSFFTNSLTFCSGVLAFVIACLHYLFIQLGVLKVSYNILNSPLGIYKSLFYRYRVKVMRAAITILLKTPLHNCTLKLVNFNVPYPFNSGCIIVTCHTQWENLLVQSCLESNYGLIIGRRKWKNKKKKAQRKGKGYSNLRNIIRHLNQNCCIIIAADSFNKLNDCPVLFRGKVLNASQFPSRLAKIASVPLIVALPVLSDGTISFIIGPQFTTKELKNNTTIINQKVISFLDSQLKNDYKVWSSFGR